ncbi:hypothetical protein ACFQ4K_32030 [Tistrella bauzanensis]
MTFEAWNDGPRTASAVEIEGVITNGGAVVSRGRSRLDYLPRVRSARAPSCSTAIPTACGSKCGHWAMPTHDPAVIRPISMCQWFWIR